MWDTKTVSVSLSLCLLVAAIFCIYQVYTEKRLGPHSENKSQTPCEKECKKYCFNGGEFFYMVDAVFVGCNCTWLYGGECCEKYTCWG